MTAIPRQTGSGAMVSLLVLAVVGCGGSGRPAARTCSAAETKHIVRAVVQAFNAGDIQMMNRLVAAAPKFQWFSSPAPQERLGRDASRRSTLSAYVQRRHQEQERLAILALSTSNRANGNFGLLIARQARDYARRVVDAKGKVDCTGTPSLIVWSVGTLGSAFPTRS